MAAAPAEPAAMEINQNRQTVAGSDVFRGKDIQKQAVLVIGIGLPLPEFVVVKGFFRHFRLIAKGSGLVGTVSVFRGVIDALPMGDLFRIFPPARRSIADALVGGSPRQAAFCATEGAAGSFYYIVHSEAASVSSVPALESAICCRISGVMFHTNLRDAQQPSISTAGTSTTSTLMPSSAPAV